MAITVSQSGFPYASSFELLEMWEVKAMDARSKQVVVRASMKLNWLDKPFMVDKLISKMSRDKVRD